MLTPVYPFPCRLHLVARVATCALAAALAAFTSPTVAAQDIALPEESPRPSPVVIAHPMKTVIAPNTAANRALFAVILKNDPAAVRRAFARGASPNATRDWVRADGKPLKEETPGFPPPAPLPLLRLVAPRQSDESDRPRAIAVFRQFLERGADVRMTDDNGLPVLMWALELRDPGLVRTVLRKGADVNRRYRTPFRSGNSATALETAMSMTSTNNEAELLPIWEMLLARRADPNVYDQGGLTFLQQAAVLNLPRLAALLLRHGADPTLPLRSRTPYDQANTFTTRVGRDATPLRLAQHFGNGEVARVLIEAMAARRRARGGGRGGLNPTEAAAAGSAPALARHLAAGLKPDARDTTGTPLLTLAAASGKVAAVRLLLDRGADPDAVGGPRGATPLNRAAGLGFLDVARLLLDRGAKIDAATVVNGFSKTALTEAVAAAQPDMVDLLLARGADRSAPGNRDALARAVSGSLRGPRRMEGQPRSAVKRGDAALAAQDRINRALAAWADVRATGGAAALCGAMKTRQFAIARNLLERGADIEARDDREGLTVTMLLVDAIGLTRHEVSDDLGIVGDMSADEAREWRAERAFLEREGLALLRYVLARRPDLTAVAPPVSDHQGRTAADIARFWKMDDVAVSVAPPAPAAAEDGGGRRRAERQP
jgi:hypothetical protein